MKKQQKKKPDLITTVFVNKGEKRSRDETLTQLQENLNDHSLVALRRARASITASLRHGYIVEENTGDYVCERDCRPLEPLELEQIGEN